VGLKIFTVAEPVWVPSVADTVWVAAVVADGTVNVTVTRFEVVPRHEATLTGRDRNSADIDVRVVCSAGTYIRVLAEEFGKRLGCGAHLTTLRRTRAGNFSVKDATTLEQLQQIVADRSLARIMVSPDTALSHLPFVHLSPADVDRTRSGMPVPVAKELTAGWANGQWVRMRANSLDLLAVGIYDSAEPVLRPRVVLAAK